MQVWNTIKEFKCECGRTFTNSQSFNGHKSHCAVHRITKGGLADYEKYRAKQAIITELAHSARSTSAAAKRDTELATWLSEAHKCEHCKKVMTEKFGSGRFCSRSCANTRSHSDESKQKIRNTLNKTFESQQKPPIRDKKICKLCSSQISSYNKTGFCRNCLEHTAEGLEVKQELGRKGYATMKINGTHKGWQSRKVTSYAEKFWIDVLENNNIEYEREFLITCNSTHYFLDFKLERNDKLIDLEIDGKQHMYSDRAELDIIRDENLSSLGYIVYRIPWNEINTDSGKYEMQQKIDKFLEFYLAL